MLDAVAVIGTSICILQCRFVLTNLYCKISFTLNYFTCRHSNVITLVKLLLHILLIVIRCLPHSEWGLHALSMYTIHAWSHLVLMIMTRPL